MKKVLTFFLIWFLAIIAAILFGIVHDKFTYAISNEYYTRFKFIQFGVSDEAWVGALATWWMGIPIGLVLGITGLRHKTWQDMLTVTLKAFVIVVVVTFITGLIGLGVGFYQAAYNMEAFTRGWHIPAGLQETRNFVAVGSMHNFSYTGGVLGLIAGVVYSLAASGFRGWGRRK